MFKQINIVIVSSIAAAKTTMKTWPHLRCIIYARYWITSKIILYIVQNLKMAEAILEM